METEKYSLEITIENLSKEQYDRMLLWATDLYDRKDLNVKINYNKEGISALDKQIAEGKDEIKHGIPFNCPECGKEIQYGFSDEGNKLFATSRLFADSKEIPAGAKESKKQVISHIHKCERIAQAPAMGEGRDWWIGKLIEPILEYPEETHCLHLITKIKDVTFLCNEADFRNLMILCRAIVGQPNESWMKIMVKMSSIRVKEALQGTLGKWVSTSEKTPPDYEFVLFYDSRDRSMHVGFFVWKQTPVDYVTHWMPLPIKPKKV